MMIAHRLLFVCVSCTVVINLSGCASIISGKTQEVTFKSVPENATIIINGKEIGRTPFTTLIERKKDQSVTVQKDGYKTESFQLNTTTNPWLFGNILLPYFVFFGSTTDYVTGAAIEYSPTFYQITLTQIQVDKKTQQSTDARLFIISNYRNILSDIAKGEGQYLSSLYEITNTKKEEQPMAIIKLRKIAEEKNDVTDFATKVTEELIKK